MITRLINKVGVLINHIFSIFKKSNMMTAEKILRKHVKPEWLLSGESFVATLRAMEEYKNLNNVSDFIKWASFKHNMVIENNEVVWIEIGPLEWHKKKKYTSEQLYILYQEFYIGFCQCVSVVRIDIGASGEKICGSCKKIRR